MEETRVWSLGWEDPPEKEIATQTSILAWEIQRREESGGLKFLGLQKSQTQLSNWLNNRKNTRYILNVEGGAMNKKDMVLPIIKLTVWLHRPNK